MANDVDLHAICEALPSELTGADISGLVACARMAAIDRYLQFDPGADFVEKFYMKQDDLQFALNRLLGARTGQANGAADSLLQI